MEAKVIKTTPIIEAWGIRVGDIGVLHKNDFPEKYDYKVEFDNKRVLFFYKDEIEVMK